MDQSIINFIGIMFTAVVSLIVAGLNLYQNHRLSDVHQLVNSRLDAALKTIDGLRKEIADLKNKP